MITGEEMKNARKKIGKTQEQLAEELDISSRKLSRLENDKNLERYDKFLQLVVTLELYKPVKEEVEVDS
ncbi:helix-turn-helix domain-containing protein [Blautia obeum]|uniref:helix-turn-helix domain-containing protein n=1 Tax=Blautia obeum TaxID=40520 RepID=UPI002A778005|nr:helix-turn-helix domain-containing protein [Lachnospiraceae bacterium]MDY2612640.1 helix-turn-helix transcriptional regulator [Lachnospiraceae bacterium]